MYSDVHFLSSKIALEINNRVKNDPYNKSGFLSLKNLSSRVKGTYMEKLAVERLDAAGRKVMARSNSQHDFCIDGKKIELKGSFLWEDANPFFRWQQIRPSDDYDYIFFDAFYPDRVETYYADKATVKANIEVQDAAGNWTYNQHGGKTKNSGTFVLDGIPSDFSWVKLLTPAVIL